MKLFKPTAILLVLLLATMVMVPMVSAVSDTNSPDKIKTDTNFVSVELSENFSRYVKAKHSE